MVAIVIVSHSATLAQGVVELARQMAADVPILAAGGSDDGGIGTDAMRVVAAIEEAGDAEAVLVLMDLGSAILSTETALDLIDEPRRATVLLSPAPLVEGAVAAAVAAQGGAALEEVAAEALGGLRAKVEQLPGAGGEAAAEGEAGSDDAGDWQRLRLTVRNAQGLHARPAARLVGVARGFDAQVELRNETTGRGPASARSLNAVATLGVRNGHEIELRARGPAAAKALAALRELAGAGFGEDGAAAAQVPAAARAPAAAPSRVDTGPAETPAPGALLQGLPGSPGIAVGEARLLEAAPADLLEAAQGEDLPGPVQGSPGDEWSRLERALAAAREETEQLRASVAGRAGEAQAEIFDAHLLLLDDDEVLSPVRAAVEGGAGAARAWASAVAAMVERYRGLDDPYQRERAADVADVGRRVLAQLLGAAAGPASPAQAGVLVAAELSPAQTGALDRGVVRAIATAAGTPTSHSAILARSLGVPAVVGLGGALLRIAEGTRLLVDGGAGTVHVDPPASLLAGYEARRRAREEARARALARAGEEARTSDGRRIEVAANIGSAADVEEAVAAGAEGVGLFRTEFVYLERSELPGEEEQRHVYERAAAALGGRRLIVRTLDAGADKPLPALPQERERNPFLGVRGIRLGLLRPDVLRTQLRALLPVATEHPVAVMFPMVATLEELGRALELLAEARSSLAGEGLPVPERLETGIMVEVPSAALLARSFARELDFLSIGTNDLTQYTLAAERQNAGVAALADGLHPAVLRLVAEVVEGARAEDAWVGVCGELAADPVAAAVLVGLGVTELSMAPSSIPWVKQELRALDAAAAAGVARRALELESAAAVRELARAELGDALRAGGLEEGPA